NLLWKRQINLGRVNNQHFAQLPHARFIEMLSYKAKLAGIEVVIQEESYTSKASFLDLDPLPVYDPANPQQYEFSGKRVERGLYQASTGRRIHADVNGSYNTLPKSSPQFLRAGDRGRCCSMASTGRCARGESCQGRRPLRHSYQLGNR